MTDPEDLRRASAGRANCPRCESDTSQEDLYCQECGWNLVESKKHALEIIAAPLIIDAPEIIAHEMGNQGAFLSSNQDKPTAQLAAPRYDAVEAGPSVTGAEQPAVFPALSSGSVKMDVVLPLGPAENELPVPCTGAKFLASLHPRAATPVVALPLIIFSIAALAAVPCACLWIESSYSSICAQYAFDQAQEAFKEGRVDQAITVMERSSSTHKLSRAQLDFLDRAYIKSANDCARRQEYVSAASSLVKVSPTFPGIQDIQRQIATFSFLARTKQSENQSRSATRYVQARVRRLSKIISNPGQDSLKIAQKYSGAVKNDASANSADKEHSENALPVQVSRPESVDNTPNGRQQHGVRTHIEDDVAKYNELLVNYFSVGKQSAEPPSFKEWVNEGKPSF